MSIARRIPLIVNLPYEFPLGKHRLRLIHQPEVLLVALLVLTTIQCFPFEDLQPAQDESNFRLPSFDWEEWRAVMEPVLASESVAPAVDYIGVTASQITAMEPAELDEYLAHLSLQTDAQCKS